MTTKISCQCGRAIQVGGDGIPVAGKIIAGAQVMGWRPNPVQLGAFLCRECSHAGAKASPTPPAPTFDELEDALSNLVTAAFELRDAPAGTVGERNAALTRARERIEDVVAAREQLAAGEALTEFFEAFAARGRLFKANAEFLLSRSQPKKAGHT